MRKLLVGLMVLAAFGVVNSAQSDAPTLPRVPRGFDEGRTHLVEESGEPVEVERFRYPGMKPTTKETAILMVVDSIEAASRTLDTPERAPLEDMVRRILFTKLASGQLDESGLSMKELRIVCSRVVETLVHMNHHRIKYPWQEERARQFGIEKQELSPLSRPTFPTVVAGGA